MLDTLANLAGALAPVGKGPTRHDDRRVSTRWPYECVQRIAVYDGVNLPPIESFHLVRCFDLSASGISFFSLSEPTYRSVVVALADFERTVYVTARVRHWRAGFWNRRHQYLVGCQFERRVRYVS
jgi:hypothetical protein